MANSYVQVPADDAGKKIDTEQVTVGGQTVQRQRVSMRGANSAVTRVADTATSTTLKAANENRVSLVLVNDSSAVLYVLMASGTASATNYSHALGQYGTITISDYTGQVDGVWATDPNDGGAQVTEVTI